MLCHRDKDVILLSNSLSPPPESHGKMEGMNCGCSALSRGTDLN